VAISDVKLPDMSGPAAVTLLQAHRPDMGAVLMSGYLSGDVPVLNHGWQFIEKPFLPYQLLAKVIEVLTTHERSRGYDRVDNRIEARAAQAGA
jgi:FixJ family two-component response regulator